MNRDSYEGLSEDLRRVFDANTGLETSAWIGRVMDEYDEPAREIAVERGNTLVSISGDELDRWRSAAEPLVERWVATMEARGIDGRALVDDARELVDEEVR